MILSLILTFSKYFFRVFKTIFYNVSITEKFNKGHSIEYYHDTKYFKFILLNPQHNNVIVKIIDQDGTDVTENVLKYMGPYSSFHKQPITPKILGYNKLMFEFYDDKILEFDSNEVINI